MEEDREGAGKSVWVTLKVKTEKVCCGLKKHAKDKGVCVRRSAGFTILLFHKHREAYTS